MKLLGTLAQRFLLSKSSEGFISFISWVSVIGVALGVLALVSVTSVINGFEGELARVITSMNSEVILYIRGEPVTAPQTIEEKARRVAPQIEQVAPSLMTELMAGGGSGVAGAVLEGVDVDRVGQVTEIPRRITQGKFPALENEVVIGYALAERIGAKVGEEVRLLVPSVSGEDAETSTSKIYSMKVSGIIRFGMYEYDSKYIFGTLSAVQKLINYPGRVSTFRMKLKPGTDPNQVSARLSEAFGAPFRAKSWSQLNKNLFYAIQLEKVVIGIILTAIVIVAAFNVVSALMMMIHDKASEIAILKIMGLRPSQSFRLFSAIGSGIGLIGIILGMILGFAVNELIASTNLIDLPADIYYISFLPVKVRWIEVGAIGAVSFLISFLASVFPAYNVSRRSPLDALRYE